MIIYENSEFIVINKPAGIASQSEKSGDDSVIEILNKTYAEVFPIHRLDKRVSGLMILALNKNSATQFQDLLLRNEIHKTYKCVVKINETFKEAAELHNFISHNAKMHKAFIEKSESKNNKSASLTYRCLQKSERYALLEVKIKEGRFHQIRTQLAHAGMPILGDLKYGYKRSSPDGSIFLQANTLKFKHSLSSEIINLELDLPKAWGRYGF